MTKPSTDPPCDTFKAAEKDADMCQHCGWTQAAHDGADAVRAASTQPHSESVKALLKRWEDRAEGFSEGAREACAYGIDEKPEHDRCMAAMNAINGCINDLTKLLPASASPHPEKFSENETKDVLTALYQDGHVDLVLADRVAALIASAQKP